MTERDEFVRLICADPEDDTVRLVFADWLEEHGGEPERGEFIRAMVSTHGPLHEHKPCSVCPACDSLRRAHILWRSLSPVPWPYAFPNQRAAKRNTFARWLLVSRGFVESVVCAAADWLQHGNGIRAAHPVTTVRLTTEPVLEWVPPKWDVGSGFRFVGDPTGKVLCAFDTARAAAEMGLSYGNNRLNTLHAALRVRWRGVVFELPRIIEASWDDAPIDVIENLEGIRERMLQNAISGVGIPSHLIHPPTG